MRAFLCAALLASCTTKQLSRINTIGAVTASAMLVCDSGQTAYAALPTPLLDNTNPIVYSEMNPVLGERPSSAALVTYFSAAVALVLVGGQFAPTWAKPIIYGAAVGVEAHAIYGNSRQGVPMCGL